MSFLVEYLKHPFTIGAVAPSSKYLAKKMLRNVTFNQARVIIEYGPGTGVFTEEIIKRKKPETVFLIIENNPVFYKKLKEKYESECNVKIELGSAEDVEKYMEKWKIKRADYVISGLPFASLPKSVSKAILTATGKILGTNGCFITFQYTLFKKKIFESYFKIKDISLEWVNLPPAFVLTMKNN